MNCVGYPKSFDFEGFTFVNDANELQVINTPDAPYTSCVNECRYVIWSPLTWNKGSTSWMIPSLNYMRNVILKYYDNLLSLTYWQPGAMTDTHETKILQRMRTMVLFFRVPLALVENSLWKCESCYAISNPIGALRVALAHYAHAVFNFPYDDAAARYIHLAGSHHWRLIAYLLLWGAPFDSIGFRNHDAILTQRCPSFVDVRDQMVQSLVERLAQVADLMRCMRVLATLMVGRQGTSESRYVARTVMFGWFVEIFSGNTHIISSQQFEGLIQVMVLGGTVFRGELAAQLALLKVPGFDTSAGQWIDPRDISYDQDNSVHSFDDERFDWCDTNRVGASEHINARMLYSHLSESWWSYCSMCV